MIGIRKILHPATNMENIVSFSDGVAVVNCEYPPGWTVNNCCILQFREASPPSLRAVNKKWNPSVQRKQLCFHFVIAITTKNGQVR